MKSRTWGSIFASVGLTVILSSADVQCATVWVGGGATTDFSDASNWDNGIPDLVNTGSILGNFTVTYSTAAALSDAEIFLGDSAGSSPSLSGGNLNLTSSLIHVLDDSELDVTGNLKVGRNNVAGSSYLEALDTSILNVSGNLIVGDRQVASMLQGNSARVDVGTSLVIGNQVSAAGSLYHLQDGILTVGRNITVKNGSTFSVDGGTYSTQRSINANGAGVNLDINGGDGTVGRQLVVQNGANFDMSGGSLSANRNINIRSGATANISGGSLSSSRRLDINGAEFTQNGGIINVRNFRIRGSGNMTQNLGIFNVTQEGLVTGTSSFIQYGSVSFGTNLDIRNGSSWSMNDGNLLVGQDLQMLNSGNLFTQTGGGLIIDGNLNMIEGSGNSYQLHGGWLEVAGSISTIAGNTFSWQSGGTLSVHDASSTIDYVGDLTASLGSILDLDQDSEFLSVSNTFSISDLTIDGYDLDLASKRIPMMVATGSNLLITGGSVTGETNVTYSNFTGLDGATLISFGDAFDPNTQDVYWFQQDGNDVSVHWSLSIPEPSTMLLLGLSTIWFGSCLG